MRRPYGGPAEARLALGASLAMGLALGYARLGSPRRLFAAHLPDELDQAEIEARILIGRVRNLAQEGFGLVQARAAKRAPLRADLKEYPDFAAYRIFEQEGVEFFLPGSSDGAAEPVAGANWSRKER